VFVSCFIIAITTRIGHPSSGRRSHSGGEARVTLARPRPGREPEIRRASGAPANFLSAVMMCASRRSAKAK
jgi:hypothetical protein